MRLSLSMTTRILNWVLARCVARRAPDVVIGGGDSPYLYRWWVIPRNRVFNIYFHQFQRSDDDRALHDHPWAFNCSILLRGGYIEHTIDAGGVHNTAILGTGAIRGRWGRAPHRVELITGIPAWTLFITGPVVRHWGFHCPHAGWVHWRKFTAEGGTTVGKGCDQ